MEKEPQSLKEPQCEFHRLMNFKTYSSRWLSEDTLTPKCTCMCIDLTLLKLDEVVHMGNTCSILETVSGERTGKRIQMSVL